jgi:rare lipoprotein A
MRSGPVGARAAAAAVGCLLVATGCASSGAHSTAARRHGRLEAQEGLASWYGPGFNGRRTASGEIYDMHDVTAAHRTLPLGTLIEVRNLENGRSAVVRVNDRGPWVRGRIVDLSLGAARLLDLEHAGIARVRLTVVGGAPAAPPAYWVQVGAFLDESNARALAADLERHYPGTAVRAEAHWWKVRVPSGDGKGGARELRRDLERAGYPALLVRQPRSKT